MWTMASAFLGTLMSEPHILHVAPMLVSWSIRWQIISLFVGMFIVAQGAEPIGAPSTLLGLVIAVCLGMLGILTWTVKELLRINERHAATLRAFIAKMPSVSEEAADERKDT